MRAPVAGAAGAAALPPQSGAAVCAAAAHDADAERVRPARADVASRVVRVARRHAQRRARQPLAVQRTNGLYAVAPIGAALRLAARCCCNMARCVATALYCGRVVRIKPSPSAAPIAESPAQPRRWPVRDVRRLRFDSSGGGFSAVAQVLLKAPHAPACRAWGSGLESFSVRSASAVPHTAHGWSAASNADWCKRRSGAEPSLV